MKFHGINEIDLFQKKKKVKLKLPIIPIFSIEITRFCGISGVSSIIPSRDLTMWRHYHELEESTSTFRYHESRDSRALRLTKFRLVSF